MGDSSLASKLVHYGLRFFQFILSAVVLGLSVNLTKGQTWGHSPAVNIVASLSGGLGILFAFLGMLPLSRFFSPIIFLQLIGDALAAIFLVSTGVAYAVKLGKGSCDDYDFMGSSSIINGGSGDYMRYGKGDHLWLLGPKTYTKRCHMAFADETCMFIAFAAFVVYIPWGLWVGRRHGQTYGV